MKLFRWQPLTKLAVLLRAPPLDSVRHEYLLKAVERDIVLPVKALFIGALAWSFYRGPWFIETGVPRSIALEVVQTFFLFYVALNVAAGVMLWLPRRWPLRISQWAVFTVSFVDGLFVAALTLVTGGFDSILYWLFLGLVVRNTASVPPARQQIILNLSVAFSFALAGALDLFVTSEDIKVLDDATRKALEIGLPENPAEIFLMRLIIILLWVACCYGVQVLFENARRAAEESRESASRQEQLRAAGRLAAEIAHKMKNPLGIINNAAFSLQRAIEQGQPPSSQQVRIIREEIDRSDRIITELMGYAQLAEGQVERLNVIQELNHAITTVFPAGVHSVQIHTEFASDLPPLLMQRNHFSEIVGNILVNAREILGGLGQIHLRAWAKEDVLFISIKDDGPGIPPDKLERIFEPYFSTKEKGTGLGLAIARHRAEMYQGKVWAESQPDDGAIFMLELPTRTFMKKRL
jgi:signal transduction histidine kinase